jgi:hypothetical protein
MFKKFLSLPLAICFLSLNFACGPAEEDPEERTLDKSGSVEVTLATEHLDAQNDVLTTVTTAYAHGDVVRTITRRDTLPSLGTTTQEAENDEGDTQMATIPKEYEVFVTLK